MFVYEPAQIPDQIADGFGDVCPEQDVFLGIGHMQVFQAVLPAVAESLAFAARHVGGALHDVFAQRVGGYVPATQALVMGQVGARVDAAIRRDVQ